MKDKRRPWWEGPRERKPLEKREIKPEVKSGKFEETFGFRSIPAVRVGETEKPTTDSICRNSFHQGCCNPCPYCRAKVRSGYMYIPGGHTDNCPNWPKQEAEISAKS